ncbi:MAG: porin family protein [Elusimicrobiaceae bacterium]|nr:porin family protein [Elusimicrobiaceae bacterium]
MRKFLFIFICLLTAISAHAYQAGDFSAGLAAVYSPLELGTAWGEVYVGDQTASTYHDAKLGKPGLGGELQALYFVSPRVGVGLSFQDQYFAKDLSSGWYLYNHTHMQNYMAVGHVFFNPQSPWKVYTALGAGLAHTRFTMDFTREGGGNEKFDYTGFAYYAGLGIEKEISSRLSLGLEARYNGQKFHASHNRCDGHHVTVRPKANFMSFLVRLIYRI